MQAPSPDLKLQVKRYRRWQFIVDTFCGILGGTTLTAALLEGYYYYYQVKEVIYYTKPQRKGNTYSIVMGTQNESTLLYLLRIYITIASVFLALMLIGRYVLDKRIRVNIAKLDQMEWQKVSFKWFYCIVEFLYAFVFLPPHVNGVYVESQTGVYVTADMLITTLMLGRMYLIWRMLYQYSSFHGSKAEEICAEQNVSVTPWFVFKSELKRRPFILVGLLLTILFFVLGFGLRQAEVSYEFISGFDWDFIMNGVWVIFLTVTTVGYGDIYPETSLGRLVCVTAAMVGSFFTSLMVIAISGYFAMSMKERNAVFRLKRRLAIKKFQDEAQIFISWAWKYAFYVRPMRIYSQGSANKIHYKMCTSYAVFKERRRKLWSDGEYAISEMDRGYYAVSDALNRNMMKYQMIMWDVRVFHEKLIILEKRQQQIEKMVDVLHRMYSRIESVTRPYINSTGARITNARASVVSFSDFGSLLSVDTRSFTQEIQSISEEIPYKYLSSKVDNAFRFRNQTLGVISLKSAEDMVQRKGSQRSSRVLKRLTRVALEVDDPESEKKEMVRSGSAMKLLKALFGSDKAKLLYSEMMHTTSKTFSKVTLNLADVLKTNTANNTQEEGSFSSMSGTPRTNKTQESLIKKRQQEPTISTNKIPTRTQRKRDPEGTIFKIGSK